MALSGVKASQDTLLRALMVDYLARLSWLKTKGGQNNRNKPKSIYEMMISRDDSEVIAFNSSEDFEAAREKILRGETNGN